MFFFSCIKTIKHLIKLYTIFSGCLVLSVFLFSFFFFIFFFFKPKDEIVQLHINTIERKFVLILKTCCQFWKILDKLGVDRSPYKGIHIRHKASPFRRILCPSICRNTRRSKLVRGRGPGPTSSYQGGPHRWTVAALSAWRNVTLIVKFWIQTLTHT